MFYVDKLCIRRKVIVSREATGIFIRIYVYNFTPSILYLLNVLKYSLTLAGFTHATKVSHETYLWIECE